MLQVCLLYSLVDMDPSYRIFTAPHLRLTQRFLSPGLLDRQVSPRSIESHTIPDVSLTLLYYMTYSYRILIHLLHLSSARTQHRSFILVYALYVYS